MNLHATLSEVGDALVLSISGIVDLSTVGQLHMELHDALRRRPGGELVVDLDGAAGLDDVGLGVLLGAAAAARDLDGSMVVVTTNERLLARLSRNRFDRAVDVLTSISARHARSQHDGREVVPTVDEPIFHLALPADWANAFTEGQYTTSTRGKTLAEVGYIHCSTIVQIVDTANRFYGDLEHLVVLTIDPQLVPSPIVHEPPAPGVDTLFPHIYGPLPVAAVNRAAFWTRSPGAEWSNPDSL